MSETKKTNRLTFRLDSDTLYKLNALKSIYALDYSETIRVAIKIFYKEHMKAVKIHKEKDIKEW